MDLQNITLPSAMRCNQVGMVSNHAFVFLPLHQWMFITGAVCVLEEERKKKKKKTREGM